MDIGKDAGGDGKGDGRVDEDGEMRKMVEIAALVRRSRLLFGRDAGSRPWGLSGSGSLRLSAGASTRYFARS